MDIFKTFSQNFKRIRSSTNLSRQAFADLLGITTQTISKFELAQRFPYGSTVNKMIEALGVSPVELFVDVESEKGQLLAYLYHKDTTAQEIEEIQKLVDQQKLKKATPNHVPTQR